MTVKQIEEKADLFLNQDKKGFEGKAVIELGKALGMVDEAKSIIKCLLVYIKHSCDDNYSNAIHEAEDFIGGKI